MIRRLALFLLLCLIVATFARIGLAATMRCIWYDGSEIDCLILNATGTATPTVRIVEAPLFAGGFE